jgi:hypothetical protein
VKVARSAEEFVAAAPDQALIERGLQMARGASWEAIVGRMRRLIVEAVGAGEESAVASALDAAAEWSESGSRRGGSAGVAAAAGEELGA